MQVDSETQGSSGEMATTSGSKPIIGKLSEFDPDVESFENFSERLENCFTVNAIQNKDKKAYFISLLGPKMYAALKNLWVPEVPKDKSFDDLVKILKEHYAPKINITYERFLFNKRNQKENESISEYAVQLKKLAASCKFEQFLEQALMDRFLCGLKSTHIQSKLLAEGEKLTFDKAVESAILVENAEQNTKSLHSEGIKTGEINLLKNRKSLKNNSKGYSKPGVGLNKNKSSSKMCFRCGKDHDPVNCPYKEPYM
jgi:hypothetical protein